MKISKLLIIATLLFALPASAQTIPPAPTGIEEAQRERFDMMLRILDLERQLSSYIEREIRGQRDQVQKKLDEKKSEEKKETK